MQACGGGGAGSGGVDHRKLAVVSKRWGRAGAGKQTACKVAPEFRKTQAEQFVSSLFISAHWPNALLSALPGFTSGAVRFQAVPHAVACLAERLCTLGLPLPLQGC